VWLAQYLELCKDVCVNDQSSSSAGYVLLFRLKPLLHLCLFFVLCSSRQLYDFAYNLPDLPSRGHSLGVVQVGVVHRVKSMQSVPNIANDISCSA